MRLWKPTLAQIVVTVAQLAFGTVTAHAERTTITPVHITGALSTAGLHVTAGQVESLSLMTSSEANPKLTATKVESLDASTTKVRLQCERTDVCLPFYVLVHWPEGTKQDVKGAARPSVLLEPLMVHNGKDATLVFEGQHMRMIMPVLCLQNGVRGQRIRVISKDRKKVFVARVTGPGTLTSMVVN
jgi:hypothetical protein